MHYRPDLTPIIVLHKLCYRPGIWLKIRLEACFKTDLEQDARVGNKTCAALMEVKLDLSGSHVLRVLISRVIVGMLQILLGTQLLHQWAAAEPTSAAQQR